MTVELNQQAPLVDDPRVTEALEKYLAAVESGDKPNRIDFLARYPDIAGALAGCLDGMDFLEAASPEVKPAVVPAMEADGPVRPLGDFHIVREVGRGGMGVVYEALQLSLGRRVALKVLPFAATLDPKRLQRFKNEAQAAAQLQHPNIVPVYAVGVERGVHYYAMQYIDGKSVAELIDELRQAAGLDPAPAFQLVGSVVETADVNAPPSPHKAAPPSTVKQVLGGASTLGSSSGPEFFKSAARLGLQVAEALDHAHQLGILHRDIKPANILLASGGRPSALESPARSSRQPLADLVPMVADFGLARMPNDVTLTMSGDLLGTLRYMSPEQASARHGLVDNRTDIYSLGATLYELLTLQPVFPDTDRQQILRQIEEDEPLPPRAVRKQVPRELETIVLKALRKDVHDRYATAQDLADDLRRYLEDRPIQARRPNLVERVGKWGRRHRSLIASAMVLLLFAVVALAVNTVVVNRERQRAESAYRHEAAALRKETEALLKETEARQAEADSRQKEAEARGRAEESFRQARRVVDYICQVAEEEMADDPQMLEIRRKLLITALDYYKEFIKQHRDDPQLEEELAATHYRIAMILEEMGSRDAAVMAYNRAIQLGTRYVNNQARVQEVQLGPFAIDAQFGLLPEGSQFRLLRLKLVQDDLHLSEAQIKAINELGNKRRAVFGNVSNLTADAWQNKRGEMEVYEKALSELLKPEQRKRLQQIMVQQRGIGAFADASVLESLRLTLDQQTKMQAIGTQALSTARSASAHKRDGNLARTVLEQLLSVLTPAQKEKWQELTGEPLKDLPPSGAEGYGNGQGTRNRSQK